MRFLEGKIVGGFNNDPRIQFGLWPEQRRSGEHQKARPDPHASIPLELNMERNFQKGTF
jgi:hypothetical protein